MDCGCSGDALHRSHHWHFETFILGQIQNHNVAKNLKQRTMFKCECLMFQCGANRVRVRLAGVTKCDKCGPQNDVTTLNASETERTRAVPPAAGAEAHLAERALKQAGEMAECVQWHCGFINLHRGLIIGIVGPICFKLHNSDTQSPKISEVHKTSSVQRQM